MTVTAVIPTLPARVDMLEAAVSSVIRQSRPVDRININIDHDRLGPATTRNLGALSSHTEWLAFLDDDDVWLPCHIETLLAHSDGADVVYSDCLVVGDHNDLMVNRDFDPFALLRFNYIPVTALVRTGAFRDVGGFDPNERYEDWALWKSLARAGARFVHVPKVTWEYRFHRHDQRTFKES